MGKKISTIEASYRILEYLKWNSDETHPTTQAALRGTEELAECVRYKTTFNKTIINLSMALNSNGDSMKDEDDWQLIFDDFKALYGTSASDEDLLDDEDDLSDTHLSMRIRNLYYRHLFSYDEIDKLIDAVRFSKMIDSETAERLIEKIETNLTTKFYKKAPAGIRRIYEPVYFDQTLLSDNLVKIQQAIEKNLQIRFWFNGHDRNKKLVHVRNARDTVSPYYVVANDGHYYLLACKSPHTTMSIWRIDLMSELELTGERHLPKKSVENLPPRWTEDFHRSHLHMSYDKPEVITLKIRHSAHAGGRLQADYTFLYDWFGANFLLCAATEEGCDLVKVTCSPYGITNWALQYSDRVEVVVPAHVRDMVKQKVAGLSQKYGL